MVSRSHPVLTPEAATVARASAAISTRASASIAKASRFGRRSDGQIGLARWKDREKALLAFAIAGRLNALDAAEGHVQQAALAAVHGREGIGDAGAENLFGGGLGGHAQFLGAQSLEVVGVKADEAAFALVQPQNLTGYGLQSQQQLAVVLRHQSHVGPGQLDTQSWSLFL